MQWNKIEMHKKYRTRSGLPVRVLCTDRKDSMYPVVALIKEKEEEISTYLTKDGRFYGVGNEKDSYDLVEISEWDDFKTDDKVLVSHDGKEWYKRHFNKVIEGVPYAFAGGITSWSTCSADDYISSSPWRFCKKAEI